MSGGSGVTHGVAQKVHSVTGVDFLLMIQQGKEKLEKEKYPT
jgi:hypothetical protein